MGLIRINLLPKTLRKRVEPGWWRLIAVAFPVITLAVVAVLQYGIASTNTQLSDQRDQLQLEVQTLQRYVRDQRALESQRQELTKIATIDESLRGNTIAWSNALAGFVGTLQASRAKVALTQLGLARLVSVGGGSTANPQAAALAAAYAGKNVTTEFTVSGEAPSVADVVRFVRAFEDNPSYGIQFNGAQAKIDATKAKVASYTFTARVGVVGPALPPAPITPAKGAANAK